MVGYSLSQWLGLIKRLPFSKSSRRPRRVSPPRIEGLEDRCLLTAHLPEAVSDVYAMDANSSLHGATVLANDVDQDGDTIDRAILGRSATNGSLTLSTDGSFIYTPTGGFVGTDSFTYFAQDSVHGETSANAATVTIHVGTKNVAPVANDATFSTAENTQLQGDVSGSDANNDPLQFFGGSTTTSHGNVSLTFGGHFTYTPDAGFVGTDFFTFVANDGETDSPEATITINVGSSSDNHAPVATSISRSISVDEVLNDQLQATDQDNDPLTFALGGTLPQHGNININPDGSFTYTPSSGFTGNDSFSFVANDGNLDSDEGTVSISIGTSSGNSAPVADAISASTGVGSILHGTLTASDADNDPLTFRLGAQSPSHGSVSVSANGAFTYTPNTGYSGPDSFTFIANDGTDDSAEATVSITVGNSSGNNAPVAASDSVNTPVNAPLNGTLTATDADNDPLTFAIGGTTPSHGSVVVGQDGSYTYTPANNFTGTDSFTFTANDGTTDSAEATITIHVGSSSGNTAPVATSASFNTPLNTALSDNLHATDADGDPLTFAKGAGPSHGTATVNSDGSFTYTPNNSFTGTDTFTFTANDGTDTSNSGTITIHVGTSSGNTPPDATDASFNTPAGTALSDTVQATDADGDTLTFAKVTSPTHGSLILNLNGSFTYTPNGGFNGTDSFTFTANDGTATSAPATVTIHVGSSSGNTAPTAVSESLSTNVNADLTGTLHATDVDGDTLSFRLGSASPTHGSVTISTNGSFTYTPDNNFSGTDSFTFIANDGTVDSAPATINITVSNGQGSNTAPVANSANFNTNAGTLLNGQVSATDADNDQLTYVLGNTASHGNLTFNSNGTFNYLPDNGFAGNDTFTFTAHDASSTSNIATVTIHVGGSTGNSTPIANSAIFNTTADTQLSGTLTGSDADNDPLTFATVTLPTHGSVNLSSTGAFVYTPNAGFNGTDSFTFTANDGTTNSAPATVTIHVGGSTGNQAPVALPESFNTPINVTLQGNLQGTDADGDSLTFFDVSQPSHGTLTIATDGSFTYVPDTNFTGIDTFFFRVTDGTANSPAAMVSINVAGNGSSNSPPTATGQSVTTDANTAASGQLNASDPDGDPLTFLAGSFQPQHGNVSISTNGLFVYTPDAGFTGSDMFSFRVNDGTVNSNEAFVTVHIGTNSDVPTANPTSITTDVDTDFTGTLTGSDPNNDQLTFSQGIINATHGSVTINSDGSFVYSPATGYSGSDFFSFKVNDGVRDSQDAIVTVHVGTSANSPPLAFPQTINVGQNAEFDGQLNALDMNGDPLTFSPGSVNASHGTVTINEDGSFSYTPNNDYSGDDLFSFSVSDGTTSSTDALVTVHVGSGTSTAPTVASGSGDLNSDEDFVSSLAPLGFDPQGDPLTFSIVSNPSHGTVSLSDDGNFIYTPNNGFDGTDSFAFKANDGTEDSNTATFTLHVGNATTGAFDLQLSGNTGTIATSRSTVTPLDSSASLINVTPDIDFSNTDLRARITAGADSHDKLMITDNDGAINVRGKRIFFNGSEVARFSGGRRGDDLHVEFNSSATVEAVNAVLQHIALRTTKRASGGTRTVEMRVNADGVVSTATIDAVKA